jgi:multisubunit Na+/H+ antiporter MnhE subunit
MPRKLLYTRNKTNFASIPTRVRTELVLVALTLVDLNLTLLPGSMAKSLGHHLRQTTIHRCIYKEVNDHRYIHEEDRSYDMKPK